MAVLPFDLDEEERKKQEEAGNGAPDGQVVGAPESSPGGSPAGGNTPAGSSPQAQGTSGWTDVNAYLDANKEQAVDTANKIGGRLTEQLNTVKGDVDSAATNFKKRVDDSTVNTNDDVLSRTTADPLAIEKNAGDVAMVKKMRDAQYGGPSMFADSEDYGSLLQKIDEANTKAKGVDSESGREAMLASMMTNPTKGMTSLDNLLIGQNKDARSVLTNAAKPFADLNTYLDTTGQGATDYATAGKTKTAATSAATKAALDATKGRLDTELNTKLADTRAGATKASQATLEKLKNFLSTGRNLSSDDLALMGITPEQESQMFDSAFDLKHAGDYDTTPSTPKGQLNAWWMAGSPDFYNVDFNPANFATMLSPDAQITKANASSAEDYARIAALEDLMGGDSGVLNKNDASQAGTANKDLLDFRGNDAVTGSKEALKQKDRQLASMMTQVDGNVFGYGGNPTDEQIARGAAGMKGFYDNVMTGKTKYHSSNPEGNARGIAGILALARLGFYKLPPNSIYAMGTPGGDAFTNPEAGTGGSPTSTGPGTGTTPTDPNGAPAAGNELRVQDGAYQWWDGSQWTEAPEEFKVEDGQKYQFDYSTGKYKAVPMNSDRVGFGSTPGVY